MVHSLRNPYLFQVISCSGLQSSYSYATCNVFSSHFFKPMTSVFHLNRWPSFYFFEKERTVIADIHSFHSWPLSDKGRLEEGKGICKGTQLTQKNVCFLPISTFSVLWLQLWADGGNIWSKFLSVSIIPIPAIIITYLQVNPLFNSVPICLVVFEIFSSTWRRIWHQFIDLKIYFLLTTIWR